MSTFSFRTNLLSSAACIFADRWSFMYKVQIISVFLFWSLLLSPEENNDILSHVQKYQNMYVPSC